MTRHVRSRSGGVPTDTRTIVLPTSDLRTRDPSVGCSEANCELARAILKVRPKGRAEPKIDTKTRDSPEWQRATRVDQPHGNPGEQPTSEA